MRRSFGFSFFAIPLDHEAVSIFQNGCEGIIQILSATPGDKWRLLSLFRVGKVEQQSRPAIVILVERLTVCNWSTFELDVRRQIIHSNLETDVRVGIEFKDSAGSS